jgi:rare lipoprotein A
MRLAAALLVALRRRAALWQAVGRHADGRQAIRRRTPILLAPIRLATAVLTIGLLGSCVPRPTPSPHYVLGAPYQAGGIWWYPRAELRLDERGLAEVYTDQHAPLTADGEVFDQGAMAAANQTLPLPAIALVTNLETGRQVKLRINDRGPSTPRRMLAVTRRVALLLGFPPSGVARVRLEVQEGDSQTAQNALSGAPTLAMTTAPRDAVAASSLAPPPGANGSAGAAPPGQPAAPPTIEAAPVAMRLPETVTQVAPDPGRLWIDLGSFPTYEFANMQRAAVVQLGATIERERQGRGESFQVTIGPIDDVDQVDRLLDQSIAAGISDARIVVR